MSSSLLIIFLGMLVPVLAATPFYLAERRAERRGEVEPDEERQSP
ncbi:hypothetical protein [Saccharopolyspora rosea]|uniref:Uncharacterized protein n=1 Tax=Saccharopolyspora rosea TaxID=524884 RepID=A0ABW3FWR1_9PSEU|nr:hypothetical protein [Saccharopolyspora rosea]